MASTTVWHLNINRRGEGGISAPLYVEIRSNCINQKMCRLMYWSLLQRFRNDVRLRNGRRVDIITDHDGGLELRIACVTKRDSGTYTLTVSNDTGTIVSRCDVNVVDRKHDDTALEQISLTNQL